MVNELKIVYTIEPTDCGVCGNSVWGDDPGVFKNSDAVYVVCNDCMQNLERMGIIQTKDITVIL